MMATPRPRLLLFAALAPALAAASPVRVEPWTVAGDIGCSWRLNGPEGKQLRASIGMGDDDPVLTIYDRAFLPFTEEQRVPLTLRFDRDPARAASAEAWSSSVLGDGERMLGMYLRADARRGLGGASLIEVLHQGKVLTAIPLAATPSQAELDACVRPPGTEHSDEE